MNFISIFYGIFILSVLGMYWSVRSHRFRLWILLTVSLLFYASLQVQYIPLLILITFITFYIGKEIAGNAALGKEAIENSAVLANKDIPLRDTLWNLRSQQLLWIGIAFNILCLFSFKYIPFVLTTIGTMFNFPAAEAGAQWFSTSLIAPFGISFFVFECIAYLIDVYRGAPATENLLSFTTYKLFFAKLISGPITRYHHFAGQEKELRFPKVDAIVEGLWLIACGAIKKALLADRLGQVVDLIFGTGNLERAGSSDLWLATFAYGLQLYLDFSGYVDMARGASILLGFNLPENFNFPYFSTSIADFWRRWHMTLGDWLRNYLYFPLGGSRQGVTRTCINLIIVMLIAGIWHGAAWGFVVWGALHGIALAIHRLTEVFSKQNDWAKQAWSSPGGIVLAWFITQLMVFTTWIFFRLPNLRQSSLVMQHFWGYSADSQFAQKVYSETIGLGRIHLTWLLVAIAGILVISYSFQRGLKLQLNWSVKLLLIPLSLFTVWLLAPQGALPYIYFDF